MIEPTDSDLEGQRRRIQRSRNIALAVILGGFVILVFAISIVKMG